MSVPRRLLLAMALVGSAAAATLVGTAPLAQADTTVAPACGGNPAPGFASCFALRATDVVQPAAVGPNALPAGLSPAKLLSAYKLTAASSTNGAGATVAVVDAFDDPNAARDLAIYRSTFGLPALTPGQFTKVSQTGSTTALPPANAGWAQEISLDLDMVSAICPKCKILLVEANDTAFVNLGIAVNKAVSLGAKYVTNSYGGSESSFTPTLESSYFNHPGVVITASTGDNGLAAGPQYPASGKRVTAVGGTSLRTSTNARGWTETVWSGAGSGCSTVIGKPSFQVGITTGCSRRGLADVSAVADPNTGVAVYDTFNAPGWLVFGGTSASSPIVAAVYALAGKPGTIPNADPYAHKTALYDVTSGSNGACSAAVQCTARKGWDGPTGLGTPHGLAAFVS